MRATRPYLSLSLSHPQIGRDQFRNSNRPDTFPRDFVLLVKSYELYSRVYITFPRIEARATPLCGGPSRLYPIFSLWLFTSLFTFDLLAVSADVVDRRASISFIVILLCLGSTVYMVFLLVARIMTLIFMELFCREYLYMNFGVSSLFH